MNAYSIHLFKIFNEMVVMTVVMTASFQPTDKKRVPSVCSAVSAQYCSGAGERACALLELVFYWRR